MDFKRKVSKSDSRWSLIWFFYLVIPTKISCNPVIPIFLACHLPRVLSSPNIAPILLYEPGSRASNKGNPGSRKTYCGPQQTMWQWFEGEKMRKRARKVEIERFFSFFLPRAPQSLPRAPFLPRAYSLNSPFPPP